MTKTPKAISLIITMYKMKLICQCTILRNVLDDLKKKTRLCFSILCSYEYASIFLIPLAGTYHYFLLSFPYREALCFLFRDQLRLIVCNI